MIKFICAFGRNAFGLSLVPVTYRDTYNAIVNAGNQPSDRQREDAMNNPDGWDYIATMDKARTFCEGGTVQFA